MQKVNFWIWAVLLVAPLTAQQNLSIGLNDPVYTLLEMAEMRGVIANLPQARPYSRGQIRAYLQHIEQRLGLLAAAERRVFQEINDRINQPAPAVGADSYLRTGRVRLADAGLMSLEFRNQLQLSERLGLNMPQTGGSANLGFHSLNLLRLGFAGDLSPYFSYQIMGGVGAAKADSDTFLPYTYTKERDGHTLGVNKQSGSHIFDGSGWGAALQFLGESNLVLFDNALQLGFNYYRRDFGPGQGNLLYSGSARPAFGMDFRLRPVEWLGLNFSSVSLGGYLPSGNSSEASMLTVQQLELFPADWLYLGVNTGVVWIKRLEPMYLIPFWPVIFTQMVTGDFDNLAMEITLALKFDYLKIYGFKLYGTFFVDEVQPQSPASLFSQVKQQFAFQLGVKGIIPGLPFTSALFQYTRIEPYAYTHYAQRNPFAYPKDGPGRLNVSWMHDGENLGFPLQPNSDEWQLRLESMPLPGWKFHLAYRFIRHGDGDRRKGEMEGRTDSVYQASKETNGTSSQTNKPDGSTPATGKIDDGIYSPEKYFSNENARKNFLKDAPYEYIHSIGLGVLYYFPQFPLALGLDYGFAYNDGPVYAGTKGKPQIRQVLGVSVSLFPNM